MPTQPNEPSCQAISIHVSIIWVNDGSTPPAATGLNDCINPLDHISSTTAGVSVRIRSHSAASAATTSRMPRASETTRSSVSAIDVIGASPSLVRDISGNTDTGDRINYSNALSIESRVTKCRAGRLHAARHYLD